MEINGRKARGVSSVRWARTLRDWPTLRKAEAVFHRPMLLAVAANTFSKSRLETFLFIAPPNKGHEGMYDVGG